MFLQFSLLSLLSAFLLFQVQPVISKFILPWFGGTPAVWTSAMLFFQVGIFVGYLYAHLSVTYLSLRGRRRLHLALLACGGTYQQTHSIRARLRRHSRGLLLCSTASGLVIQLHSLSLQAWSFSWPTALVLVASLWAGGLLVIVNGLILLLGGYQGAATWTLVILYFTLAHSSLVMLGILGLAKALAGQCFRFPLVGPPLPAGCGSLARPIGS